MKNEAIRENIDQLINIIKHIAKPQGVLSQTQRAMFMCKNQSRLIILIQSISPPLQSQTIEDVLRSINQSQQLHPQNSFIHTVKIKFLCRVVTLLSHQKQDNIGRKYLRILMDQIKSQNDLKNAIFFIFRVNSLVKLTHYRTGRNKEFKYDQITQALFYYIISILQPRAKGEMEGHFCKIYLRISQKGEVSELLTGIHQSIIKNIRLRLLQKVIQQLNNMETEWLNKRQVEEQMVNQTLLIQKGIMEYANKSERVKTISKIMQETEKQPYYPMLIQQLSKTTFIQKMLNHQHINRAPPSDPKQRLKIFKKMLYLEGKGDFDAFKRCQIGTNLLKYNYRNSELVQRFVRLGYDGISWGKDPSNCDLKYEWKQIGNLFYGKVTPNLLRKGKQIDSRCNLSLYLKQRSVDFICHGEDEAFLWVQAITYILNQHWKDQKNKDLFFSKGTLLWKSLFIHLRGLNSFRESKAESIFTQEDRVRCFQLKRRFLKNTQ